MESILKLKVRGRQVRVDLGLKFDVNIKGPTCKARGITIRPHVKTRGAQSK